MCLRPFTGALFGLDGFLAGREETHVGGALACSSLNFDSPRSSPLPSLRTTFPDIGTGGGRAECASPLFPSSSSSPSRGRLCAEAAAVTALKSDAAADVAMALLVVDVGRVEDGLRRLAPRCRRLCGADALSWELIVLAAAGGVVVLRLRRESCCRWRYAAQISACS